MTTAAKTRAPRLQARSRWSHAAKCGRMGAYGLLGVEPEEVDDKTRRLRLRGKQLGQYVAQVLATQHGKKNIVREKEVAWPAGILHTDVFLKNEGLPVEVKSSNSPDSVIDDAFFQLAGEILYDPDALHAAGILAIVNPVDLWIDWIPFKLTDAFAAEVEARATGVLKAGATRGRELPDRVCGKPGDARGKFCPFAGHCFDGWTPPPPLAAIEDPTVKLQVTALYEKRLALRNAKAGTAAVETEIKELEQQLDLLDLRDGFDYEVGPVDLRKIIRNGSGSFRLAVARKAGIWTAADDERFAAFMSPGSVSHWYRAERKREGNLLEPGDFGDVPWTDEDLEG